MNLKINPININLISDYQNQYYDSIESPFDDYWAKGIIANGACYEIIQQEAIGYLITSPDNILLQFYLYTNKKNEAAVFKKCIDLLEIKTAHISTYEPCYLGRCLDLGLSYDVIALFYKHTDMIHINKPLDDIKEVLAHSKHLAEAVDYAVSEGGPRELLTVYYNSLLKMKGLYIYKLNNKIIGTGELRTYSLSTKISNIGMTVSNHHRHKNIGSYILYRMTTLSYLNGLTPICGTDINNIVSQKTIEKCGYYPYHRALQVEF